MYDFLHRRKRTVQIILGLITLPFAFFGVDYYFRGGGDRAGEVARVAGTPITQGEFDNTLREQQERMRQALGGNFDPAVFDDPEVRYSLLDGLIGQRLLQEQTRRGRFSVSDDQLGQFISDIPAFQEGGKFSQARYEQILSMQNPPKSPIEFAREIRRELMLGPVQESIVGGNIVARTNVERYLGLLEQQREAAVTALDADAFLKEVKIDDAAVKAFYDANPASFQVPEEVKLEYVTLSPDTLGAQIALEPAEIRKQYDDNARLYGNAEERLWAHIFISSKPEASEEEKTNAKKKAAEIAAQARKNPAQFGELAKKFSQDPGSSAQGGDLGSFARDGSMVKPFEDAVFSMKQGDIVGPVQTDFGWHIIRITAVKPGKTQSLDEAKPQIEQDLKRQKATRKFVEAADQFQNLVYEQADSLQAAAKGLNLEVKTTPMLTRAQVQALAQNSPKLVQAVFSAESLQAKRNTEALEVAPNTLMAARVIDYKPATTRPFDDVKVDIRRQLERNAASELAQKAGREKLALLEQGKDAGLSFGTPVAVTRNQPQPGFAPDALIKIFQVNANKLPAYVGALAERGSFSIYKMTQVVTAPTPDPERLKAFNNRVGDQVGHELFNTYLASLKTTADVQLHQLNLEKE